MTPSGVSIYTTYMRKLATIRTIDEVLPIEGADAIVLVKIDGWKCVALKEEFEVGDLCVYFEIDSFIPITPAVEHLRARAFKRMGDKEGIRIKTIKLRGQLSQGLALPVMKFPEVRAVIARLYDEKITELNGVISMTDRMQAVDWSEILGVELYELPIPAQLAGQVRGNFPSFIKKTEQERCQNLGRDIFETNKDSKYEITMKLDGSSFTAYFNNGGLGVCSRNMDLELGEWNQDNSLVRMFVDSGLQAILADFGRNIAVQGELMGPGIQKNREGLLAHKLFIFDIYDIDCAWHFAPQSRYALMDTLYAAGLKKAMVDQAPIIAYTANLYDTLGISKMDQLLTFADGKSLNHAVREGLVFKRIDGGFSFKVINNKFLLKEED